MKKSFLFLPTLLAMLQLASLQGAKLDYVSSRIISPALASVVTTDTPVLIGMVRAATGKPLAYAKVTVFLNYQKVGIVETNRDGIWSYRIKSKQRLADGFYLVEARVQSEKYEDQMTRASVFNVQLRSTECSLAKIFRSGNVSVAHSEISFPYDQAYINTTVPTVVGVLRNVQSNPVAGETVQVKIDSNTVGTVTSDSNGVFSYTLTSEQALTEASHTVGAHCVETNVDLTSNSFTVDVTPPAAPTITAPTENQALTTSLVTIQGTSEANATITTFMDGNSFGDISYADGSGNWGIEYVLSNGNHSVTAQAEDLAFNAGNVSSPRNFSVNA